MLCSGTGDGEVVGDCVLCSGTGDGEVVGECVLYSGTGDGEVVFNVCSVPVRVTVRLYLMCALFRYG